MISQKECLLIFLSMNVVASYASEKPAKKAEKFDEMKSLYLYIEVQKEKKELLRKELELPKNATFGADLQHGGKYVAVPVNKNIRFGRGSSGSSAKL